MNKNLFKTIIIVTFLILGTTSIFAASQVNQPNAVNIHPIHPSNSNKYNDHPTPLYPANNTVSDASLLSKENMLDKISKTQFKASDSYIKSALLKTWKEHSIQDDPNDSFSSAQIDDNRKVWVVTTCYPSGMDSKIGFYENATVVSVFDAQTGTLLESTISGTYKGTGKLNIKH